MDQEVVVRLVVLFADLVVKVHGLGHLHGLVVSSQHYHLFGVFQFKRHKQEQNLDSHRSSIDIVSQKQHMLFGFLLERGKQADDFEQIKELSMYVSNHNNWFLDEDNVRFVF
jgi:arginyl-tRNA--protein-N-Asp/Glu arginylyltransferase